MIRLKMLWPPFRRRVDQLSLLVNGATADEYRRIVKHPDSYWDGCKYRLPLPNGERPFETEHARHVFERKRPPKVGSADG